MENITTEDLIRYVYQETSLEETAIIEAALDQDWTLREKCHVLKDSLHTLDKMIESPRPESINAILKYAGVSKEVEHL